jgi:RimJ/RimL family protein N-acetyltransferase
MRREAHFIKDFYSKGEWTDSFIYGMLVSDLK